MPFFELPSERLTIADEPPENLAARDFAHVWGVMCYPEDERARRRLDDSFTAASLVDEIRRARTAMGRVLVEDLIALKLAAAPNPADTVPATTTEANVTGGMIAGLILGWVVFRARRHDTRATASIRCACRMIHEACVKGRGYGKRKDNVRQHVWSPRSSVAHLWAGMRYHQSIGTHPIHSPSGVPEFLITAEAFRREGESIRPKHSGPAVLDASKTWKLREETAERWPSVDLTCETLDEWDPRVCIELG